MRKSNYQKNGDPEKATWQTDPREFRGYTRAKLEDIHDNIKTMFGLIDENRKEITNNRIETVKLSVTVALLVTGLVLAGKVLLTGGI